VNAVSAINNDHELPQGMQLMPMDEKFRNDPYSILKQLRERAPVHHDAQLGRYICTRHDDVKSVLRDKEFFTDPRKANPGSFSREVLINNLGADGEPSMLLMDEPEHRRVRSLVNGPFKRHAVEKWRPHIRGIVQRVLASIDTPEFDLIEQFAGPVPTVVIAEMLGVDPSRHDQFKQWSDLVVQISFNPFPTPEQKHAGNEATEALEALFLSEIDARGKHSGDDLLGALIRSEESGDKLSPREIVLQCLLLLVAGNETTTDLIGNGIKALLDHPQQLAKLRVNPGLIENAVEEMLRYDSPVINSGRIPNRDISLAGCPIPKGESVSVSLAGANRDPAVYANPDIFDINREDTHHQSFGGGRHLCLGAHLARVEAQEAILALLDRYPTLRHADKGFAYHSIPAFRGMREFWVATMP
jgi:cytochrome P450